MINLPEYAALQIRSHGESDFPHECCGLLLGHFAPDGAKVVTAVYPISNAREEEAKRNRFLITPEELMLGEKYARQQQVEILGFYHSHPNCPARPSQFDLDHAWPIYSYVIVSVCSGRSAELLSWELEPDRSRFNAETIEKGV